MWPSTSGRLSELCSSMWSLNILTLSRLEDAQLLLPLP